MENHLVSLQLLSQSIAQAYDSATVYSTVREAVEQQFGGSLGLVIAYHEVDSKRIQIPYLWVDGEHQSVEPYPLQEDAISEIIRKKKDLLLAPVEEDQRLVNACFSIRPAVSLIGVPLQVHGSILGALVVMRYEEMERFHDDDLLFLRILAAQVAVHVYSDRMLENNRLQIKNDRLLFEATNKIRDSVDMQTIIETTAQELGRILMARRVHIDVDLSTLLKHLDEEHLASDADLVDRSNDLKA